MLILRGEHGFISHHRNANTLDANRSIYDIFTLQFSNGLYHIKGQFIWVLIEDGIFLPTAQPVLDVPQLCNCVTSDPLQVWTVGSGTSTVLGLCVLMGRCLRISLWSCKNAAALPSAATMGNISMEIRAGH